MQLLTGALALCALIFMSRPCDAQQKLPQAFHVSGRAAATLSAVYLSGEVPFAAWNTATVNVVDASAVEVRVEMQKSAKTFESLGASVTTEAALGREATVTIPGSEAKAIAVAYSAWVHGNVQKGASPRDLASDHFVVIERAFLFAGSSGKPGYYVTYRPLKPKTFPSGLHCAAFTTYRVDPVTWDVFQEPHIC